MQTDFKTTVVARVGFLSTIDKEEVTDIIKEVFSEPNLSPRSYSDYQSDLREISDYFNLNLSSEELDSLIPELKP